MQESVWKMALEWHYRTGRLDSDRVACYSEEYESTYWGLCCEMQMKRSGITDNYRPSSIEIWKTGFLYH